MRRLGAVFVLLLCVLAPLLAATAALAASPSPSISPFPGAVVYKIGVDTDYDGMNPFSSWSSVSSECFRLGYDYLTWYDRTYRPAPDLATSWQTSTDGKTWTFHIREGMTWQDGVPLTAHDIAFTYNLIMRAHDPTYGRYLTGVTRVVAPDDTTLVISTRAPDAGMLAIAIPILPEHIWKNADPHNLGSFKNWPFVGSGPFRVTDLKRGQWVEIEANPSYPRALGGPPKVDAVYFVISRTADSLVSDYRAGRLDAIVGFPATYKKMLSSLPDSTAVAAPTIGFHELGFNCGNAPGSKGNPLLKDAAVREAVHWAIDTAKIAAGVTSGLAVPGTSLISPAQGEWHWDVPVAQQYHYDPARARQILTAAGYVDRDGDGVRENLKGQKLSFRLVAMSEDPAGQAAAAMIVSWCRSVGIALHLEVMDEGTFGEDMYDHANYDMFVWSWGDDIDPGPLLSTFTSSQILKWGDTQYADPAYDKLFVRQSEALDVADPSDQSRRQAIVHEMQKLLYRDNPYVVLWYNVNLQAFRTKDWTGYQPIPAGHGAPFWNYLRGSYIDLRLRTAAAVSSSGGSGSWVRVAVAGPVVLIGLIAILYVRRRSRARVQR